jgi:hypothetical protein
LAAAPAPLAAVAAFAPALGNRVAVAAGVVAMIAGGAGQITGALAAVWAAVWFDFFFTVPYDRFTIRDSSDVTTFVLLLVVGLVVSQIAARARRLHVITITDADYLAQIHSTATLAQSARSGDAVVDHVREQLIGLLGLERCRFEYGSLIGQPPRLEQDGTVVAGRAGRGRWDVEQAGFPAGDVELRVFGNGQYYGRFMMTDWPASRPSLQARLVAVTLADQAGRALSAAGAPRAKR